MKKNILLILSLIFIISCSSSEIISVTKKDINEMEIQILIPEKIGTYQLGYVNNIGFQELNIDENEFIDGRNYGVFNKEEEKSVYVVAAKCFHPLACAKDHINHRRTETEKDGQDFNFRRFEKNNHKIHVFESNYGEMYYLVIGNYFFLLGSERGEGAALEVLNHLTKIYKPTDYEDIYPKIIVDCEDDEIKYNDYCCEDYNNNKVCDEYDDEIINDEEIISDNEIASGCTVFDRLDCVYMELNEDSYLIGLKNNLGFSIGIKNIISKCNNHLMSDQDGSSVVINEDIKIRNKDSFGIKFEDCKPKEPGEKISEAFTLEYFNYNTGLDYSVSGELDGIIELEIKLRPINEN